MPTPVITNTQLGWAFQTGLVNRIKSTASFLTRYIFGGREENAPTESMELSYKDGERLLAPFVEVNSEAISVGGRSTTFANVSFPNIRIKRPMEAYNVFNRRQPGTGMFIDGGGPVAAARTAAIAEDAAYMVDLVDNRLEWMVSKMVNDPTSGYMTLEYKVEDRATWQIKIPRSTDVTKVLASTLKWSAPTTAKPRADFHTVKRAFSKHVGLPVAGCIMGSAAADYFMAIDEVKTLLDNRNISAGILELQNQFNDSGAIYLGNFCGVPCWEYSRNYYDNAGSEQSYMDTNTAVFVAGGNNESKIWYGAIPDHDAFEQGLFVGKRFSKSWKEPDPSIYVQLLQTRPLPLIRRPNSIYVLTVNS